MKPNFYALATMEFLSSLGSEDDAEIAYENMSEAAYDDGELDDEITFWEPFEHWPVEDVVSAIDNLASRFEYVYEQGILEGMEVAKRNQ
jgi:hypothetical protein